MFHTMQVHEPVGDGDDEAALQEGYGYLDHHLAEEVSSGAVGARRELTNEDWSFVGKGEDSWLCGAEEAPDGYLH